MVDGDDREWWAALQVVDGHGRLVKGCGYGVDGDGGEGGGGVLEGVSGPWGS